MHLTAGATSTSDSDSGSWGIAPFYVKRRGASPAAGARFDFGAPTTGRNALRVLRALQLRKPVLLEGSPGVGKTSLVAAMARCVGGSICLGGRVAGRRRRGVAGPIEEGAFVP